MNWLRHRWTSEVPAPPQSGPLQLNIRLEPSDRLIEEIRERIERAEEEVRRLKHPPVHDL